MFEGGVKDKIKGQQSVGERDQDNSGNQSEEKDVARISWFQWMASKSKLKIEKPNKIRNFEKKTNGNKKDPFLSLLSAKLNFPGNQCSRKYGRI